MTQTPTPTPQQDRPQPTLKWRTALPPIEEGEGEPPLNAREERLRGLTQLPDC
jgi:hypothetical protein